MELSEIKGKIEAILFASGEPVSAERLSEVLACDRHSVHKVLQDLRERYGADDVGIALLDLDGSYQLSTKTQYADDVRRALELRRDQPLSPAALEVLAVVAYNEPVTRAFVSQVRGVDSDGAVVNLVEKGLLEEAGRLDLPGRPIAYRTTDAFLRCFQLRSLQELPPIPDGGDALGEQLQLEHAEGAGKSFEYDPDDEDNLS